MSSFLLAVGLLSATLTATGEHGAFTNSLETIRHSHESLQSQYAQDLIPIAQDLRDTGETEAAETAWRLAEASAVSNLLTGKLPDRVLAAIPSNISADRHNALIRFRSAREKHSVAVQNLARQALSAGSVQLAFELILESARQNPDNPIARRVLGYVRYGDQWVSPFESRMRRADQVWHEQFGWLPKNHVNKYEAGERFHNGRWISSTQDEELHRQFSNPWIVRTEHYLIKTNHSLEHGVRIATKLEEFHGYFSKLFAEFFKNPQEMQALFRGSSLRQSEHRPYVVHYYRTREEYNQQLIRKIPRIAMTNGLYYTADRIAYFFHHDDMPLDDALYHEATHQILYETLPNERDVGGQSHFWVIEGLACYMETFRPDAEDASTGDPEHERIVAARYRYLVDRHYAALARFDAMGVQQFQNLPYEELQRNYSQAAGLAHFFMHYDDGRYRDAFIAHISQLYQAKNHGHWRAQTLQELTGRSYAMLDQEYGEYMKLLGVPRTKAIPVGVSTQSMDEQTVGEQSEAMPFEVAPN